MAVQLPLTPKIYYCPEPFSQGTFKKCHFGYLEDPLTKSITRVAVLFRKSQPNPAIKCAEDRIYKKEIQHLISLNKGPYPQFFPKLYHAESDFFVLEYCDCSLHELKFRGFKNPYNGSILTLAQKVDIISQTYQGFYFLHYNNFVHLDLKPANILFSFLTRQIKIADLATLSCVSNSSVYSIAGTYNYSPPEFLRLAFPGKPVLDPSKNKLQRDLKADDAWRLALTSCFLLTDTKPTWVSFLEQIENNPFVTAEFMSMLITLMHLPVAFGRNSQIEEFVKVVLDPHVATRPTVKQGLALLNRIDLTNIA